RPTLRQPGALAARKLNRAPRRLAVRLGIIFALSSLDGKWLHPCGSGQERGMSMELASLRDLYVSELRDLYSAENQIVKALPKMAKAASATELQMPSRNTSNRRRSTCSGWKRFSTSWTSAPRVGSARRWKV